MSWITPERRCHEVISELLEALGCRGPFVLETPGQFLPPPPPALVSRAWARDFNEVQLWGRASGSPRTQEQTDIARERRGLRRLTFNLAATTKGFGNQENERIYVADFTGTELLVREHVAGGHIPTNRWLFGHFSGKLLSLTPVSGPEQKGRPLWAADFTGTGRTVLLEQLNGALQLRALSGATLTATKVAAGVPGGSEAGANWIGEFSGERKPNALVFHPSNGDYWLGTYALGAVPWKQARNTIRPFPQPPPPIDGLVGVFGMKVGNPESKHLEVHVLTEPSRYQQYDMRTATPITQEDAQANFDYALGDYDGDGPPDLFCLKRRSTGTGTLEVHVLPYGYQNFSLHTGTPITLADAVYFDFAVGDYNHDGHPDVICLKRQNTGTGRLEVHVLNGADNYQSFLLHTGTPISETDAANFVFAVGDFHGDGHADLFCLKKQNTGTGRLEVHVLNGADGYQSFLLHTGTPVSQADAANFIFGVADYDLDKHPDLFCLKQSNTGTGQLEVHVLKGADNYQSFLLQTGTPLGAADAVANWRFAVAPIIPGPQ